MSEYHIRIQDLQPQDRPRERLLKNGPSALSDSELLAIILRTGTRGENVLNLCSRILSTYNIQQLSRASPTKLQEIHGVGAAKAAEMTAMFELARRLETFTEEERPRISSPEAAYRFLYPKLRELKKESFIALHLDTKNRLLREETVSVGSLNANIVHPREVFKTAIQESAAAIIVAHNHPSGDPTPSQNDIDITRKLVETGRVVGIELYDHIIVGDGRFLSLKEQNLM
ncbi:MAG: DNA repair protein RadC [ANME-2 cluster archaeon]|jgi:DNA repair protein RadC|nr:DNA repair protein RadC [ANME-2 cluster archaeon]